MFLFLLFHIAAAGSAYKQARFEVSLLYTYLTQKEWCSSVMPRLFLCALPLERDQHELQALNITRVLGLVEPFERARGWLFSRFVWPRHTAVYIDAEDFAPLTYEQLDRAVSILRQWMDRGERVIVHCKAGRGRSAAVIVAYLAIVYRLTGPEAYHYLKEIRSAVNLNVAQSKAVYDYIAGGLPLTYVEDVYLV